MNWPLKGIRFIHGDALTPGAVFVIEDPPFYSIDPKTHASTGVLQQFEIAAVDDSSWLVEPRIACLSVSRPAAPARAPWPSSGSRSAGAARCASARSAPRPTSAGLRWRRGQPRHSRY